MSAVHIVKFIQSLNAKEIQVVDDHIQSIYLLSGSNSDESKQLKLFRYITQNNERQLPDTELTKEVSTANLASLKYLLSEKIYDALLLNKHIENKTVFNPREQIVFTLKKKILLIKTLYRTLNQGRTETVSFLLAETIKTAKKNEVFDVLIEALILQKYYKAIRTGFEEFDNINTEISFFDHCFKCVQYANDAYYRLILNREFVKSLSEKELEKHLQVSISQMEIDFRKTKSQEINYFKHIFHIALYEHKKNYKEAINYCKKLLLLVKNSPVIYSKDRIGFAMGNLSMFSTYNENYKAAALNAQNAQKFHIPNSMTFLIIQEQEFFAHFYGKNYKQAIKCSEEMLQHSLVDTGGYRKSKFIYYEACVLFATKHHKEALQLLNKSLEIEKDKTGWNIALRILTILVFIELNKINEASRALEALRKYMERLTKSDKVKSRDTLIIKLLREIEKDGFKISNQNNTALKILKELSDKDKNKANSWNYYTPELIPFHEWVKGTASK